MATPFAPLPRQVGILVLEAEPKNSGVLKQILDSEGWRVRVVPDIALLHAELKTAEYSLLIANVAMVGIDSPTFHVLRELATVSAEDGGKIRTLFVLPETGGSEFVGHLEIAHLPYVLRPFHLHDFLEKVSDLLVEVKAIEGPLRMTRYEFGEARKKEERNQPHHLHVCRARFLLLLGRRDSRIREVRGRSLCLTPHEAAHQPRQFALLNF